MPDSPETPRPKPKMAQGRKAGSPPEETPQEKLKELIRNSKKLQTKKIKEITKRDNSED